MKVVFIILLLFGGCVSLNIYFDERDAQLREAKRVQFQESLKELNVEFNKNLDAFADKVKTIKIKSHYHERDEFPEFRGFSSPFTVEVEEHFPKDTSHLWPMKASWIDHYLIDVQSYLDDLLYEYIFVMDDFYEPYSVAFSLTCTPRLLEYIRAFEELEYTGYGSPYLFLTFDITDDIVTQFGELEEEDEYYFSRTFNAKCNDYIIADQNLIDSLQ